jgi:hypothetical protein
MILLYFGILFCLRSFIMPMIWNAPYANPDGTPLTITVESLKELAKKPRALFEARSKEQAQRIKDKKARKKLNAERRQAAVEGWEKFSGKLINVGCDLGLISGALYGAATHGGGGLVGGAIAGALGGGVAALGLAIGLPLAYAVLSTTFKMAAKLITASSAKIRETVLYTWPLKLHARRMQLTVRAQREREGLPVRSQLGPQPSLERLSRLPYLGP